MDNFNIRAYLAEGRLNEEEGVNSRKILATLEDKLKNHDFTYGNADGKRYTKGVDERKEINDLIKALGKSDEAIALYNRYAAKNNVNNNGSDYTIKKDSIKEVTVEEKRPDYPDVDNDGDTEESMEKALKDKEPTTAVKEGMLQDVEHIVKYSKPNDTYQVWLADEIVTDFATKEKADAEAKRLNALQDTKKVDEAQIDEGQVLKGIVDGKPFYIIQHEGQEMRIKGGDWPNFKEMIQLKESLAEDLDIGHQDNEPGMLKAELYHIGSYAMELYKMMDALEGQGEVDFPAWWQSKITTAKTMISGAKHYLEFELKEPAIEDMVDGLDGIAPEMEIDVVDDENMEESIDKEFHSTSNTNGHPDWRDKSAIEIQDYIGAPSIPLWGRELRTAEMVRDQKIDSGNTSLNDEAKIYFMRKVQRGEIDTLPEDPKAEYLAQMTRDQMDHDKETSHREGGLGEASFYTDDVKSKVISKLMDQLKK